MALDALGRTARPDSPVPSPGRGRSRRAVIGVGAAALVAIAAWIPYLRVPLGPDEAGFLMLAQHWHSGTSLYGDYWVDRPPLLIWLFSLAGHLGPVGHGAAGLTAPGVKVLGALASGLSVVLAAVIARQVAPLGPTPCRVGAVSGSAEPETAPTRHAWSGPAAVIVAVALLADPLLGMPETNGEVLALPFVLAGIAALLAAARRQWWRSTALLTAAAGASAACAALVKQNVVDVVVLAVVLFLGSRGRLSHPGARIAAFVGGGALAVGLALAAAAARGTSPTGLFDATVAFRFQAAAVIRSSASSATSDRFSHLLAAAFTSGLVAILALTVALAVTTLVARRRAGAPGDLSAPLLWAALAMTAWELVGVAGGGSYWLHYLTGLLPGVVLLVALVRPSPRWRTALTAAVSWAVVAGAATWAAHADASTTVSDDARVVAYLRTHARPGDGVVVTFGHPNIVAGSGLASPYEYPWSLPARVRDPRLTELSDVLSGRHAPRFVVVAGESIETWGVDATTAQQILEQNYAEQGVYGDWHVWKREVGGR